MSAQLYALVLAFPFFLYALYEDLRFRAVTPLPLVFLAGIETALRVAYDRDAWSLYFFVLLSLVFIVVHKTWPKLLPEGDVYVLIAALSALWGPWSLYVFLLALAVVDVLVRAIYAMRLGKKAFTEVPLPLVAEVVPALVIVLAAQVAGLVAWFASLG